MERKYVEDLHSFTELSEKINSTEIPPFFILINLFPYTFEIPGQLV